MIKFINIMKFSQSFFFSHWDHLIIYDQDENELALTKVIEFVVVFFDTLSPEFRKKTKYFPLHNRSINSYMWFLGFYFSSPSFDHFFTHNFIPPINNSFTCCDSVTMRQPFETTSYEESSTQNERYYIEKKKVLDNLLIVNTNRHQSPFSWMAQWNWEWASMWQNKCTSVFHCVDVDALLSIYRQR